MGWGEQPSGRKLRLPANWEALRLAILQRDKYTCHHVMETSGLLCGRAANQVDHIQRGDNHDPSNLQALCPYHHGVKSGSEGGHAAALKRKQRELGSHYPRPTPNG